MATNATQFFQHTVTERLTAGARHLKVGVTLSVEVVGAGQWTVNLRSVPPSIEPGVAPRVNVAVRLSEPTIQPGDVYVFNGSLVHAVGQQHDSADRLTLSCLFGRDPLDLICVVQQ